MLSTSGCDLRHMVALLFLSAAMALNLSAQRGMLPTDTASDTGMGGTNSISGRVYVTSGQKVSKRMRVRLSTMTVGDRTSTTDDSGNFLFRGLKNGTYTVVIDGEAEFEPFKQSVSIMNLNGSPGQEYPLMIRLAVKKTNEPKPAIVGSDFADVPQAALDLFKKAGGLSKTGDYNGAVEQLQLAIKQYSKFTYAYNELGVQYLRLNDLVNAGEAFRSAIKIKPEAFAPMINLGVTLFRLKDFAGAETVLREVVKMDEKSAPGHYFLGESLAYGGKFDEAEKELNTSVTLGGDEMKEAHRYLAIIYGSKGDKKRQLAELEIYLRLEPKTADAEQLRNLVQQLKGGDK